MPTTDRKLRPRRGSRLDAVPEQLAAWFAGEIPETWYRLLPYEVDLLPARWRSYKATHPSAKPPPDYEWLDNPADPRHPTEAQVRESRRLLARSKCK